MVYVCAPTGSAAFSAGGETIHRLFGIRVNGITENLTPRRRKKLLAKFSNIVVLIVDERSMLQSELLAVMEAYSTQAVHNGLNTNKPWGHIPIILLVGDDFQLPPVNKGAFDSLVKVQEKIKQVDSVKSAATNKRIQRGHHQFHEIGKKVMYLKAAHRQLPSQQRLARILKGVCGEDDKGLDDEDVQFLAEKFHLMSPHFTEEDRKELYKEAMFLFANRKPKQLLNNQKLCQIQSDDNPVARIKSKTMTRFRKVVSNNSHYDNDSTSSILYICIGSKVAITGNNICPEWALYNGAQGTVIEIVYNDGESPNNNDLPAYVLVEFSIYFGPVFDPKNKTLVPIVPFTVSCNKCQCCERTFIPLKLAFAKTSHTFQGQNAGPVAKGQPPNAVQRIIVDPGTRQFEGQNPGLFYTILSRITTLGDDDDTTPEEKRYKNSAIYFIGNNMNQDRIKNITRQKSGEKYANVVKRERWVRYLKDHEIRCTLSPEVTTNLFNWANTEKFHTNS